MDFPSSRVGNDDVALSHHRGQVAIAQPVGDAPANALLDGFSGKAATPIIESRSIRLVIPRPYLERARILGSDHQCNKTQNVRQEKSGYHFFYASPIVVRNDVSWGDKTPPRSPSRHSCDRHDWQCAFPSPNRLLQSVAFWRICYCRNEQLRLASPSLPLSFRWSATSQMYARTRTSSEPPASHMTTLAAYSTQLPEHEKSPPGDHCDRSGAGARI